MAEGDRFERSFPRGGWRKAYRRARLNIEAQSEVADLCIDALARTLRLSKGVPRFGAIVDILNRFDQGLGSVSASADAADAYVTSLAELEANTRAAGGHRLTKIAAETAKSLLADRLHSAEHAPSGPIGEKLAEGTCRDIIDNMFFPNARLQLVAEGVVADLDAAARWHRQVEAACEPRLNQLAVRLAKDTDATKLRSPRRSVSRRLTRELLDAPLASIAGRNE
jgi:hypothetical protein